jgi:hypothetical protein
LLDVLAMLPRLDDAEDQLPQITDRPPRAVKI